MVATDVPEEMGFSLFCPYTAVSTIMATLLPLKTNIEGKDTPFKLKINKTLSILWYNIIWNEG